MAQRANLPLERIVEVCERFYARDGFVKWTDVGEALGVTRQSIQLRLKAATERGELTPETIERWQSMSSRAATAREREAERYKAKKARERLLLRVQLTEENMAWLRETAVFRGSTSADIINGLLTRERQLKQEAQLPS